MRRPWQVWMLFGLCLAAVVPAMAWLTLKTLELDRAEALASARADLEEEINLSLWRMDSLITPILAEEAARPFQAYLPVAAELSYQYRTTPSEPSPLLTSTPGNVLLHFQRAPDGSLSSPQNPIGAAGATAPAWGIPQQAMRENADLLEKLQRSLGEVRLVERLKDPEELKDQTEGVAAWANRYDVPQLETAADPDDQSELADGYSAEGGRGFGVQSPQAIEQQSQTRGRREFSNRLRAAQNYGQKAVALGRQNIQPQSAVFERVKEGVSQPLWVGDQLLFARRVKVNDETVVQGCWLNWPKIKQMLLDEARRVPQADLVPVRDGDEPNPARMLATLPVRLVVDEQLRLAEAWSPIKISLLAAWICLFVAALAVAATLLSVVRLSERRGAFVSAVTHELRTPLTTFRMYSEMLAEDMVPEPEKRKQYLQTMRAEADRLRHMVENVLSYARLERGRRNGSYEQISVESLIGRVEPRLSDRARQAGMQLSIVASPQVSAVNLNTSVTAVEQILFNLVDNACKYASDADDRRIEITLDAGTTDILVRRVGSDGQGCPSYGTIPAKIRLRVRDHGPGIPRRRLRQLFQPFWKSAEEAADTAPGIGLGLGLCRRLARDLGGRLQIADGNEGGAEVSLCLPVSGKMAMTKE